MMNRNQFLSKLAAELSSLPKEEIEAAMEFYTEFLDDVGKENEEEAIPKRGLSAVKWTLLGIFQHCFWQA